MYKYLEAKILLSGKSKQEIADAINVNINTLYAKLSGKTSFLLDEAFAIKDFLNADEDIECLFKKTA